MTRQRIFKTIQIGNKDDFISRFFDIFIACTILINIAIMLLLTFSELEPYYDLMHKIELVTIIIFCIEYALRIWTADYLFEGLPKWKAILKFLISFDGIVDLFTILPFFYLSGFVAFRMLRVVRIFHLFRINAQYDSFNVITSVLYEKRNQILSSLFILIILMLASSIGIYAAEHEAQPNAFENAFSGIWWSVSALLTVGYGDIYPITVMGKIMAIMTAFLGVGVVAIPTGIISAGFVEQYTKIKHINSISRETELHFIRVLVHRNHMWNGKYIKETNLPQGLLLALILRKNDVIIPRGDVLLEENDIALLAAESYYDDYDLKLKEVEILDEHPWIHTAIKDLDISRQTTIVSIHRKNKLIIPTGKTIIKPHDKVILYSKLS